MAEGFDARPAQGPVSQSANAREQHCSREAHRHRLQTADHPAALDDPEQQGRRHQERDHGAMRQSPLTKEGTCGEPRCEPTERSLQGPRQPPHHSGLGRPNFISKLDTKIEAPADTADSAPSYPGSDLHCKTHRRAIPPTPSGRLPPAPRRETFKPEESSLSGGEGHGPSRQPRCDRGHSPPLQRRKRPRACSGRPLADVESSSRPLTKRSPRPTAN